MFAWSHWGYLSPRSMVIEHGDELCLKRPWQGVGLCQGPAIPISHNPKHSKLYP